MASLIGVLVYFISYLPFILVMSLKYEINFASKIALVGVFILFLLNFLYIMLNN